MSAAPERLDAADARALGDLADVLDVAIRLHDREADRALIEGLRETEVPEWIAGILTEAPGPAAAEALRAALDALPRPVDPAALDDLAAEFADIYLTHGYRVSPNGSVWLTEDRLERQIPMFEVREWYAHYDISVPDWRLRSDDHLVHELQFVSFLLHGGTMSGATDAARFLDRHVLTWVPDFCARARQRLRRPFYVASAELTDATLAAVRARLTEITGLEPRIEAPEPEAPLEEAAAPYLPGVAASW